MRGQRVESTAWGDFMLRSDEVSAPVAGLLTKGHGDWRGLWEVARVVEDALGCRGDATRVGRDPATGEIARPEIRT